MCSSPISLPFSKGIYLITYLPFHDFLALRTLNHYQPEM
jgi:hypothetical protein